MQNRQGGIQPRKKTVLDLPKFKLVGELNADGKRPTFHPYLHVNANDQSKNSPRIVVYTNLESDKQMKQDQIQGEMDLDVFLAFIDGIRDAADPSKDFKKETYDLRNYIWMNGQRSEEAKTKAYLIVGRKENGVVFVSLKHFDTRRPAIAFDFGFNEYTRMVSNEGPIEPAVASRRIARARAKMWETYMLDEFRDNHAQPQPKQQQGYGGNQNGGGNYGGNNNTGYGGNNNRGGYGGGNQGGGGYDPNADQMYGEEKMPF